LALAHPDEHASGVNGRDLQLCSFPQAQATGVEHLQTHPGFGVFDHSHQAADFLRTQPDRQLSAVPGPKERADRPRALPRDRVEEPDPREVEASRARRDLLLIEQGEEVLPDLLFTDLIGRLPVVWGQVFDGFERARLSLGGQTPEVPVFAPTASERSHGHPPVRGESHGSKWSTRIRKIDGRSACGKKERRHVGGLDQPAPAPRFRSTTIRLPNTTGKHCGFLPPNS
jgi:hypothetical protein